MDKVSSPVAKMTQSCILHLQNTLRCAARDGAVHRGSVSGKRWSVALSPLKAAASRVPADPLLFTLLVWPSRRLPRPSELIPVSCFCPAQTRGTRKTMLPIVQRDCIWAEMMVIAACCFYC